MPVFGAYEGLPFFDQMLHGAHFMLCAFAVLVACVPLMTEKGSPEHKFGGMIYLPLSLGALFLATYMAWREASLVLFTFNAFCAYLLMSGWRAVHENETPSFVDWGIPGCLFLLAVGVTLDAMIHDQGMRSFYLIFFAFNAFVLSWRDWKHLRRRAYWNKRKIFLVQADFAAQGPSAWMGRHIAGMIGSLIASLSVVVLTLLPLSLHWLWPVSLLAIGLFVAYRERQKKLRLRRAMPASLREKFSPSPMPRDEDEDFRRAA